MSAPSNAPAPALPEVTLQPIGAVESPFRALGDRYDYASGACVRLWPELEPGLTGIEYFSHLWVIYRQHRSAEWLRARGWGGVPPLVLPDDDDRAGEGVFSSRAPCRPAALGSCIVELVRREGTALHVRGLDAVDGTPVLDVKPYVPQFDAFPDAAIPLHWARVMERPGDATRLSRELHWDTTHADFTLGLRAGVVALARLGAARGAPLRAELAGSAFFAQGFELATGCSPLRGTLAHADRSHAELPWSVRLLHGPEVATLSIGRVVWPDAARILSASADELFAASYVSINKIQFPAVPAASGAAGRRPPFPLPQ